MRCVYCAPAAGARFLEEQELLSFDEIERVARIAAGLGVRRIRLTGGEPLLRAGLPRLVRRLHALAGIADLSLTTNGARLRELAQPLHDAGLHRVNVSLDSLDHERFRRITGRRLLPRVLAGLEAAARAGLSPIKVNVVALPDLGEAEVLKLAELARTRPYQVRFIEFMPFGAAGCWRPEAALSGRQILECIGRRWALREIMPGPEFGGPAAVYRFADGQGEVGTITAVSEPFCDRCARIRVTADGRLRTCLFAAQETDLRALLRAGASDHEIATAIAAAVSAKQRAHHIGRPEFQQPGRAMQSIGG